MEATDDVKNDTAFKRKRGRPRLLSASIKKMKKLERDRTRARKKVNLGVQFERWCQFGEKMGLQSHEEIAKFLLDVMDGQMTYHPVCPKSLPSAQPNAQVGVERIIVCQPPRLSSAQSRVQPGVGPMLGVCRTPACQPLWLLQAQHFQTVPAKSSFPLAAAGGADRNRESGALDRIAGDSLGIVTVMTRETHLPGSVQQDFSSRNPASGNSGICPNDRLSGSPGPDVFEIKTEVLSENEELSLPLTFQQESSDPVAACPRSEEAGYTAGCTEDDVDLNGLPDEGKQRAEFSGSDEFVEFTSEDSEEEEEVRSRSKRRKKSDSDDEWMPCFESAAARKKSASKPSKSISAAETDLEKQLKESAPSAEKSMEELSSSEDEGEEQVLTPEETKRQLFYHNMTAVGEGEKVHCARCQTVFDTWRAAEEHVGRSYSFTCDFCLKMFHCVWKLGVHRRTQHLAGSVSKNSTSSAYVCTECSASFLYNKSLVGHMKQVHGITVPLEESKIKFTCNICQKSCLGLVKLGLHVTQHFHDVPCIKCRYVNCMMTFSSDADMKVHYQESHLEAAWRVRRLCQECGMMYPDKKALKDHVQVVHKRLRSFPCDWPGCDKSFFRRDHFFNHLMIHTGEKPIKCQLCDYTCRQHNSLRWHMKKHGIDRKADTSREEDPRPQFAPPRGRRKWNRSNDILMC